VARYALAESYKTHGEVETAIAVYQELESSGGYSQGAVLYELGRLHEEISKPDEARSYYQRIVGEFPDSPFRDDVDRALKRLGTDDAASEETES
jgi:TolA-binding protein